MRPNFRQGGSDLTPFAWLRVKGVQTFHGAFGAKSTPIPLNFNFLWHFYAEIGSKVHFSAKNAIFSKGAFSAKILPPNPKLMREGGAETLDLEVLEAAPIAPLIWRHWGVLPLFQRGWGGTTKIGLARKSAQGL